MKNKTKMIVVDDEPQVLESLTQIFDAQFDVLAATDSKKALALLDRNPDIAIFISDQRMPGMRGVELLKIVKQVAPEAMRILLTGYADLEAVLDSVNLGEVFRYVRKPWAPETLKSIVALAMASYTLRHQKKNRAANPEPETGRRPAPPDTPSANEKSPAPTPPVPPAKQNTQPTAFQNPSTNELLPQDLFLPEAQLPKSFEEEFLNGISLQDPEHFFEDSALFETHHKSGHLDEEFLKSYVQEVLDELKKFDGYEDQFFAKLMAQYGKVAASEKINLFEKAFYGRSGKPKILIVDDEAKILSTLSESLVSHYEILTCTSADAALDIIEGNAFIACIMTDMRMPKKSGMDFLAEAQVLAPLVPKILMTAEADADEMIKAINKGLLFRHVSKPWAVKKLIATLDEAIRECRERIELGLAARSGNARAAQMQSQSRSATKPAEV
jgi:response regulator RpfG family c-di-GMP phosphodiesterase